MLDQHHSDDLDPWDPNNWDTLHLRELQREHRIYLDDRGAEYAIVDPIDYQWAVQWRWNALRDKSGNVYARRAVSETVGGVRLRTSTAYLHVEIQKRTKKQRPSRFHVLVDHRNGKSLDCRRSNLRWATPSMNTRNQWGRTPRDLADDGTE